MAALTLADMYIMSPYMLEQGIILTIQEESQLADTLSFENIQAMTVQTYRSGKRNPVSWRKINEAFKPVIQGKPVPVSAGIYSFGTPIDVDYLVRDDKTPKIVDPVTQQVDDTIVTMARQFNDAWVNNEPTKDPDALVGLRYIINEEFPGQKICANPAGNAVLDLSPTGANYSTNISIFFLMLDKAINAIDGKKPNFAVCNSTFLTHFRSLCRDSGYLKTTEDSLGRSFIDYNGVKFIDAGNTYEDTDASGNELPIITDKELYNGTIDPSNGNSTSVLFVRQDKKHYQPWQYAPLSATHIGMLDNGVHDRTLVKWDVGHIVTHPRSLSWLTGLKFA